MKSRYDVSDLPYLLFIALLDDIEASASMAFDSSARSVAGAAELLPMTEIWKARRDE